MLQGGGALGSYQAGVYQALHEAGIEPDWIIGTSIGAINASLIAGNAPQNRLSRLREFWKRMEQNPIWSFRDIFPGFNEKLSYWSTVTNGIPGFFRPNPLAHAGDSYPLGADQAGYYSTSPLERTLTELVDFDLVNQCTPRLTVGAAHVRTSQMRYFDSRDGELGVKHIMASGALPPAFPAVRIDGELYWDGGILSNTPTEAVFDDNPRKNSLIFAVHLWNPSGAEPTTMAEVLNRHKDVQYSSRIASHIARQQQAHRLRHVINQLAARLPEAERNSEAVRELAGYGCPTRMHVVRLLAPQLDRENHTKDIDFSPVRHHAALGRRLCATPNRCSNASRGSASSIRSPASFSTSRWKSCRRRRSSCRSRDDGRRDRLAIQRAVTGRRQIPAKGPRHRAAPHRVEAVLGAERIERAPDAAEEGFRRRLREQETGFAVLDGLRQPAGLVTDRQRSEPLRIHLAQPAWFEPRRHQGKVAAGKNSPRLGVVEADGDADRVRPAAVRIDQRLFDLGLAAAGHHDLSAGLDDFVGGGQDEIDALLVHQAGDKAEQRSARQRQAELLADVIGIGLLAFPIAGGEGLRQMRAGAGVPAFVDAVQDAGQLRGVRAALQADLPARSRARAS